MRTIYFIDFLMNTYITLTTLPNNEREKQYFQQCQLSRKSFTDLMPFGVVASVSFTNHSTPFTKVKEDLFFIHLSFTIPILCYSTIKHLHCELRITENRNEQIAHNITSSSRSSSNIQRIKNCERSDEFVSPSVIN